MGEKKRPFLTIEEIADRIAKCPEEIMYPEDKLPKIYDRDTGVEYGEWSVEDVDYSDTIGNANPPADGGILK